MKEPITLISDIIKKKKNHLQQFLIFPLQILSNEGKKSKHKRKT